jgi:alpha-N-arabinofuranosidase
MRILLIISSVSIFLLGSCKSGNHKIDFTPHDFKEQQSYENPVIKGFFPDPSICKAGDDYYLVTSSFEYFPGVPIFHSRDLVNWEHIGNVLDRQSQLPLENAGISGGIWAPVIRYNDGIFYMISTLMPDGRNFIVHTKDPADSWSEPVYIDQKNIDPSLFFDDDGKVYYTGTAPWDKEGPPGVYQAEIDIETGKLQTEYRHIWSGTGGRYPEGPHLYKIGKMYYLMISEGGTETGHTVTIARADNPWGPFESCPDNPVLTNRNQEYSNPVQNSGHADFIQDNENKWWMVHLAVRNVNKHHHLGRETLLLPVEWDEKGWPVINQNGVSQLEVFAVPPGIQIQKDPYGRYEFNESFGPEWNYIRNPVSENYMMNEEEGLLVLVGNENSLDSMGSPTFIGIRQKDFNMELTSKLSFDPKT